VEQGFYEARCKEDKSSKKKGPEVKDATELVGWGYSRARHQKADVTFEEKNLKSCKRENLERKSHGKKPESRDAPRKYIVLVKARAGDHVEEKAQVI